MKYWILNSFMSDLFDSLARRFESFSDSFSTTQGLFLSDRFCNIQTDHNFENSIGQDKEMAKALNKTYLD